MQRIGDNDKPFIGFVVGGLKSARRSWEACNQI